MTIQTEIKATGYLTIKGIAARIVDLEGAVSDLLTLADNLAGASAQMYEVYQRAQEVLAQKVGGE